MRLETIFEFLAGALDSPGPMDIITPADAMKRTQRPPDSGGLLTFYRD